MPKLSTSGIAIAFAVCVLPRVGSAQAMHAAPAGELEASVLEAVAREDANRATLRRFVQREDVQDVVRQFGYAADDILQAVEMLDGESLNDLAVRAAGAEQELAGGDQIVIGTTALIIGLLVLIVILVAD